MLKKIIPSSVELIFPEYFLSIERTLFECDFYDTHYRYFDQVDDAYLNALNMSPENLILKWGFEWPEFYTKVGLEALKTRSRPYEGIRTWKDVNYEYLYYFGQSCSFLGSDGFKFFLPAALFHYLARPDRNNSFMDSFVFRLDSQWGQDVHFFNDSQKKFIIEFVKEHYDGYVLWASLY